MVRFVNFRATDIQPNPDEVMYWVDLATDPLGGSIKTWNAEGYWETLRVLEGTLPEFEERIKKYVQQQLESYEERVDEKVKIIEGQIAIVDQDIESLKQGKQDKLVAGAGINISDNVISCIVDLTLYKVVLELPTKDIDPTKIYLVLDEDGEEGNIWKEYIYVNNYWELMGEYQAPIDLSPYLTKEEAQNTYATRAQLSNTNRIIGITGDGNLPDLSDTNYLSNSKDLINNIKVLDGQIADGRHEEVWEVLYNQFTVISGFSVSPTIIEKGVSTSIKMAGKFLFNNEPFIPQSVTLKRDSVVIHSTPIDNFNGITDNLDTTNDSVVYRVDIISNEVQKSATATVRVYYPMFFGHSPKTSLTSTDITGFTKQPIKSSPNGTYSMNVNQGDYVWLCVPSNFNISKVTSSGFGVPMENPISVTVDSKGTYKCYRTSGQLNAGTFDFTIG